MVYCQGCGTETENRMCCPKCSELGEEQTVTHSERICLSVAIYKGFGVGFKYSLEVVAVATIL